MSCRPWCPNKICRPARAQSLCSGRLFAAAAASSRSLSFKGSCPSVCLFHPRFSIRYSATGQRSMLSGLPSHGQRRAEPSAACLKNTRCTFCWRSVRKITRSSPVCPKPSSFSAIPVRFGPKIPLQTQTLQYPLWSSARWRDRQQETQGKAPSSLTLRNVEGPSTASDQAMLLERASAAPHARSRLPDCQRRCDSGFRQLDPAAHILFHSMMQGRRTNHFRPGARRPILPSGNRVAPGTRRCLPMWEGAHPHRSVVSPLQVRAIPSGPSFLRSFPADRAIFITHHHWDHVHIPTLMRLDRSTPILIPETSIRPDRLVARTDPLFCALGL